MSEPSKEAALAWYAERKSKQCGRLVHPRDINLTKRGEGTAIAMTNAYADGYDAGAAAEREKSARYVEMTDKHIEDLADRLERAAAERERIVAENAARDLAVRELIEAAEEFRENDGSLGEYDLDSAHRLDAALAAVRAFYPEEG